MKARMTEEYDGMHVKPYIAKARKESVIRIVQHESIGKIKVVKIEY